MKGTKAAQFEAIVEKIGETLEIIESGDSKIEDSLKAYEEGIKLIREAQDYLKSAEQRITVLSEDLSEIDTETDE